MHTFLVVGGIILGAIAVAALSIFLTVCLFSYGIAMAMMKGLGH